VGLRRGCSKTGCRRPAVATLTYAYADRAPRGWDVVRVGGEFPEPVLAGDDLLALADAVREAGRPRTAHPGPDPATARGQAAAEAQSGVVESGRRGHLRILRDS
jgi:hypothetical protein